MEIIDLTMNIDEELPTFPTTWHISPKVEPFGLIEDVGRNTSRILMSSHTGTHVDAPKHFIKDGISIEQIQLEVICGDVRIIDFRHLGDKFPIDVRLLESVKICERMLFAFGWDQYRLSPYYYRSYPYFTSDAAEYLVGKGVKFIAMDTPSPDNPDAKLGSSEDSEVHKIFLKAGVILAEYLCNTDKINFGENYMIFALPIKLKGCDGAPARIILIRKDKEHEY